MYVFLLFLSKTINLLSSRGGSLKRYLEMSSWTQPLKFIFIVFNSVLLLTKCCAYLIQKDQKNISGNFQESFHAVQPSQKSQTLHKKLCFNSLKYEIIALSVLPKQKTLILNIYFLEGETLLVLVNGSAQIKCDVSSNLPNDQVLLVVWYKNNLPIYRWVQNTYNMWMFFEINLLAMIHEVHMPVHRHIGETKKS